MWQVLSPFKKEKAGMNYQLNPALNYVHDPYSKKGYILSKDGSCSVVNSDAMQLLTEAIGILSKNIAYNDFFKKVKKHQWVIPFENKAVSVRKVTHTPHLKRVQFELLLQCNLFCAHCYCSSSPHAPRGLNTPKIFDLIDQLSQMGTMYLDITGGEPLLRKDIFSIIEYGQKRGLILSLFTNATTINEKIAAKLAGLKIASIQTSLDALTPSLHDEFRGQKGAHQKTIRGIRLLKKFKIPTSVTVMVHQKNKDEIKDLASYIKNELGIPFRLDRVIPSGRALDQNDISLSNKEFYELISAIFPKQQPPTTKVCDFASAVIDKSHIEPACGVGISYLFIKQNGDVVLCPTMTPNESPLFTAGNLLEQKLEDIWLNHLTFQKFRGIQCRNIGTCPASEKCQGGCRSNAYLLHGSVDSPDELYCNLHKNSSSTYVSFSEKYQKHEYD